MGSSPSLLLSESCLTIVWPVDCSRGDDVVSDDVVIVLEWACLVGGWEEGGGVGGRGVPSISPGSLGCNHFWRLRGADLEPTCECAV